MLTGANLDPLFWSYAFHHALFVHSLLTHGDKGVPHTLVTGEWPDLSKLRTLDAGSMSNIQTIAIQNWTIMSTKEIFWGTQQQ